MQQIIRDTHVGLGNILESQSMVTQLGQSKMTENHQKALLT